MSIADSEQYAHMLDAAAAGDYAYPAVNVTSSETLNAALRGFAAAESDGIVEMTTGGATYVSGAAVGQGELGARALASFAHEVGRECGVLVALQTDHCAPDQVETFVRPLLGEPLRRRERGEPPLFNSHMFDGSSLPLEENLRRSAELLEECARAGVLLEVECGVVGGAEDDVSGEGVGRERLYTTTEDLLPVTEVLGTGERRRYLLAATFGNVHGRYKPATSGCGPRSCARVKKPSPPFTLERTSSTCSTEVAARARRTCMTPFATASSKINVDTDMQFVFTRGIADHVQAHDVNEKEHFDPRSWGRAAEAAMAAAVTERCALLGSAGRTLSRSWSEVAPYASEHVDTQERDARSGRQAVVRFGAELAPAFPRLEHSRARPLRPQRRRLRPECSASVKDEEAEAR